MALPINLFVRGLLITSGAIAGTTAVGWYWKRNTGPNENDPLNEKIRALGISRAQCMLPKGGSFSECELDLGEVKTINFYEKGSESELEVLGMGDNERLRLRIEKGHNSEKFPEGLRLTFTNGNAQEISLGKDPLKTTLKHNVGRDYSLQTNDHRKIMETWTLQKLGGMVGLTIDSSEDEVCNVAENENNKVNVWRSGGEYVIGATKSTNGNLYCQMNTEKDVGGYTEGFKFTVKGDVDIALTGGTGPDKGKTMEAISRDNVSYEIAPKEIGGERIWFLVERR